MPKYSYECPVHGAFDISVPISQHSDHPPCPYPAANGNDFETIVVDSGDVRPSCQEVTLQTYTPERAKNWAIKPIVIHVGEDGKVRFPGDEHARVPKGFNRVELKSLSEIRAFEKEMNQKFSSEAARHHENEERHFEAVRAQLRGDLRQRMQTMSAFGRAFAQFCIDANNQRRRKSSDVGFQVQVINFDQSNREPYRPGSGFRPRRGT